MIWGTVAIVLAGSIWGVTAQRTRPGSKAQTALRVDKVMPADWRRGVDEAKVVLVEYGDYQCAACAQYHSMIEEAMAEYGNRIAFVYRHFPLRDIHRHAGLAARAAEAAGRQGKFWEMHNLLYRRQDEWATTLNAQAVFEYYAQSLGLDRSRFLRDLDDDALRGKVENDFQSGVRAEVSGTPASYLQGKQFPYPSSYVELRALLEEALRAADSLGGKKEPTAVAPNTIVSGP